MRRSTRRPYAAAHSTKRATRDGLFSSTSARVSCAPPTAASAEHARVQAETRATAEWTPLCSTRALSCALTLESGQVFAWRRHPRHAATWLGVVQRRVFALQERDHVVHFRCLWPADVPVKDSAAELSHYFRLDVDEEQLYRRWTAVADRMSGSISRLRGLRIVRQDPVECLFAFICSSNNNIARIQTMVDKLRATYGDLIYKGEDGDEQLLYAFPAVETLAAKCEESVLRALGFGYRAAFVVKTAKQLQQLGGPSYLDDIRDGKAGRVNEGTKRKARKSREGPSDALQDHMTSYHAYQEDLMVFAGVGRKVADCVALFSLERMEAIPVDTHVWQIACRELDATLSDRKSITPTVYRMVGDLFRTRFAPQAGWAHSVLFAGDLSAFKTDLVHKPIRQQVKRKLTGAPRVPASPKNKTRKPPVGPM